MSVTITIPVASSTLHTFRLRNFFLCTFWFLSCDEHTSVLISGFVPETSLRPQDGELYNPPDQKIFKPFFMKQGSTRTAQLYDVDGPSPRDLPVCSCELQIFENSETLQCLDLILAWTLPSCTSNCRSCWVTDARIVSDHHLPPSALHTVCRRVLYARQDSFSVHSLHTVFRGILDSIHDSAALERCMHIVPTLCQAF